MECDQTIRISLDKILKKKLGRAIRGNDVRKDLIFIYGRWFDIQS